LSRKKVYQNRNDDKKIRRRTVLSEGRDENLNLYEGMPPADGRQISFGEREFDVKNWVRKLDN